MARQVGGILTESILRIHIPEDWVIPYEKKRYVYTTLLSARIITLSKKVSKTSKFYYRYRIGRQRNLYNNRMLYGLEAIDIDNPQDITVSAKLEIIVGEGKDEIIKVF
jgi:hypothetical protein